MCTRDALVCDSRDVLMHHGLLRSHRVVLVLGLQQTGELGHAAVVVRLRDQHPHGHLAVLAGSVGAVIAVGPVVAVGAMVTVGTMIAVGAMIAVISVGAVGTVVTMVTMGAMIPVGSMGAVSPVMSVMSCSAQFLQVPPHSTVR